MELEELKDDETNTQASFKAVESLITRNLRNKSPNDYSMLRNHLVTYYRSQTNFDYDGLLDTVFGSYVPDNPDVKINELRNKAKELPEVKGFDRVFSVKPDTIKARIRKTYKVNSVAELRIIGSSNNLRNLISSEYKEGEKVIQIKTDNDELFDLYKYK